MRKKDFFKQRVLLIFGYNGKNYHGLQAQKGTDFQTIESKLYEGLHASNLVGAATFNELNKLGWSRGARTDKGVHALCNGISVKLYFQKDHLTQNVDEMNKIECKKLLDVNKVRNIINSNLPVDIKVHTIKFTTQGFDVRKSARCRFYEYIAPISLYQQKDEPADSRVEEIFTRIQQIVKKFEGTHNFHNYSRGMLYKEPQAIRYIMKMEVEKFEYQSMTFIRFLIQGQSFIYHQIRKMMGVIIQLFQEELPDNYIDNTFFQNQLRILLAPPEGLFLNRIDFESYNRKIDIPEQLVIDEDDQKHVDTFKPIILDHICNTEVVDKVFSLWLANLRDKNFQIEEVVEPHGGGEE